MDLTKATIKHLPLQTCLLFDDAKQDLGATELISYLLKATNTSTAQLDAFDSLLEKCEYQDVIIITNNFKGLQYKLLNEALQSHLIKHRFYLLILNYEEESLTFNLTPQTVYVNAIDAKLKPYQIKTALQKELKFIRKKILATLIAASKKQKIESKFLKKQNFRSTLNFLIHAHYSKPQFTTLELAKTMGVSVSTLERKTFDLTGKTPKQYLLEYRLQKAKNELISSYKKIGLIAKTSGFASASYFSISFYERFGMSPSQVRQGAALSAG